MSDSSEGRALFLVTGDRHAPPFFTFAGSAFPITDPGATPVFVDSEPRSWNPDATDAALLDFTIP